MVCGEVPHSEVRKILYTVTDFNDELKCRERCAQQGSRVCFTHDRKPFTHGQAFAFWDFLNRFVLTFTESCVGEK